MIKLRNFILPLLLIMLTAFLCLNFLLQPDQKENNLLAHEVSIQIPVRQEVTDQGIQIPINIAEKIDTEKLYLLVSQALGTSLLSPQFTSSEIYFALPSSLSKRAGVVSWQLMYGQEELSSGNMELLPKVNDIGRLDAYLGPRSIFANPGDFTMLVSIPTDVYGNLLPDATPISINTQFGPTINKTTHYLEKGFAWQRIPAPLRTGRISAAATLDQAYSKELVADVLADVPTDFEISASTHHNYADGNAIATFSTTPITDTYGNLMPDGTLVQFRIEDLSGSYWNTSASTVNGSAFAKAVHPQVPTTWKVQAFIVGMAESVPINLSFASIIDDIPLQWIGGRLHIGPLNSYLGQLVPDGTTVSIRSNNTYKIYTRNGMAIWEPPTPMLTSADTEVVVQTLGKSTTTRTTSF